MRLLLARFNLEGEDSSNDNDGNEEGDEDEGAGDDREVPFVAEGVVLRSSRVVCRRLEQGN